jgi:hypothetical protein
MSILRDRIASGLTTNPDLTVVGVNMGPTETPLVRVGIFSNMITYEDMQPIITADGAPVYATSPGTWGQLYAAGRM